MIEVKMIQRLYGLPIVLVAADQATKFAMLELIFTPPRIITLLPFLNLRPVWNKGVSFGMLGDAGIWAPLVLTIFAIGVGLFLPHIAQRWDRWSRIGAMLMSGGALGNAIDRMIHGKVVDFIDVFIVIDNRQWHWPAFNLADSAIVIGVAFILFGSIRSNRVG